MTDPQRDGSSPAPGRPAFRALLLFVLGVLLLGAALWAIARQEGAISNAWHAAKRVEWPFVAAMFLLPMANWALTTSIFWVLTGRYGKVGWREMGALIASAWLLNFLPMRPGMVGRLAYHKRVNLIRVQDSMKVLVAASITTGGSVFALLGILLLIGPSPSPAALWAGVSIPAAALAAMVLVMRRRPGNLWRWPCAALFRYGDVGIWAIRYWIAFIVIGKPVSAVAAAAVTVAGQAAMLAPVQIGLREWVIGAAGALLPADWADLSNVPGAGPVASMAPGLMADMTMRVAELAIAVPLGLGASLWLWRGVGKKRAGGTGLVNPDRPEVL